jgi:chromosome segregation ATPase
MRISNQQRQQNEARIRAAMDRLLRGEIPVGRNCDISTLAKEADVDRTAFYGTRPYAHLREEFETRLARIREAGDPIGPSEGQISRLKNENTKLKARLAQANSEIDDLTEFRTTALARLAAQHEEITRLRNLNFNEPAIAGSPSPVVAASLRLVTQ